MDFSEHEEIKTIKGCDENDDYEEYESVKRKQRLSPRLRERFGMAADKLHKKDVNYRFSYGLNFVLYLLLVIIGALAVRQFIFEPTVVEGESMENTLIDGERVLVEKVSYWFGEPKRGDIVIVHYPNRRNTCFVKRVIALAGETIEIQGRDVFINGEKLDEFTYAWFDPAKALRPLETAGSADGKYTVPEGYIFVMGDNRCDSHDSRSTDVGAIPLNQVLGKAQFVIWPFDRLRSPYK